MVFAQRSLPSGWKRVTGDSYNNALMYTFSTYESFTWLGGSDNATGKFNTTTTTTGQRSLPSATGAVHTHGAGYPKQEEGPDGQGWPSNSYYTFRTSDRGPHSYTMLDGVQNSSGGSSHTHPMELDLKYCGVMICYKE